MSKEKEKVLAPDVPKKGETFFEFVCCCLSCWLLSVGVCLLLDAQVEFEVGLGTILWQTLLTILVVAVMSRRWWIPLAYIGGMLVVGLIVFVIGHNSQDYYQSAISFIQWWIDFQPEDSEWYAPQSFYIIHTFINMGISILFFAVARIMRRGWITALLCLGIIIAVYTFGYPQYNLWAIVFVFVGLFPMAAQQRFTGQRLFKRHTAFSVMGNRWLIVVICVAICLGISGSAVAVLDNDRDLDIRNRFSSNIAADVQTAADFYTSDQQSLKISLFELGLQSNTRYIGGGLYKQKTGVIAVTDQTDPFLVRMTTFGTYNGKKWSDSFEKTYRINGPWKKKQTAYLAGSATEDDFLFSKLRKLGLQKEITFTLTSKTQYLPGAGQILNFTENVKTKNPNLFDARGQLICYFGQNEGYSYTVNTFTYNTRKAFSLEQRRTIMEAIGQQEDPVYTPEFAEYYTAIPGKLPEAAEKVLDMLDIDEKNPYDAAYKIAQSFSGENDFSYSEKPPFFSKEDDIVEKLFETKTGHCVYYSTAMIMMARKIGIPSRLAAGYRTIEEDGLQVVSRSEPYCWVECYFPNLGWIAFDPSPGKAVIINVEVQSGADPEEPADPGLKKPEEDQQKDEEPPEPEQKFSWFKVFFPIGVLLAILLYLLSRAWWAPRLCRPESVCRRLMSPILQAEFFWRDMLNQYRCIGYTRRKGETMRELTTRVSEEFIYRNEDAVMQAVEVIEALHYGGKIPTNGDIDRLANACAMLDMEAKWKMKPAEYFFKRRMFLPVALRNKKKLDPTFKNFKI